MFKLKNTTCFLGKALKLSTEKIELMVTLDVGPRIIWLGKKGGENIMFNDENDLICKDVSQIYGENEKWHIYGGHRIWIAPEEEKTYYPDNNEVTFKKDGDTVSFIPPLLKGYDLQTKLHIKYVNESCIEVGMEAINKSSQLNTISIWALTVLKPNAELTIKTETKKDGYLPTLNVVYWPYTDLEDKRLNVKKDLITVKSSDSAGSALKIGTFNKNIVMTYKYKDTTFIKRAEGYENEVYPDMFCNFETYTNDLIHEAETLSPIKTLKWRESLLHKEIWEIE